MPNREAVKVKSAGECRQCRSFCDKLIEPARCLQIGCRYAYSYEDELSGRTYMGCMHNVFSVEIDIDLLRQAERSLAGYGGVKVASTPLPHCPFTVERTFEGAGEDYRCGNLSFFDCSNPEPYGYRARLGPYPRVSS